MTFVVGLTGGIGSGKTVASDHFAELGVPVIDTDIIARRIVEPEQPVLNALIDAFGDRILLVDGHLNRSTLREIAFSNSNNKRLLDEITHPAIRSETLNQIGDVTYPYCVIVVPLLTKDSPFNKAMHRIVVVTAKHETKIARVKKRSNLNREEVERIMATQLDDQARTRFSDDVIANDGSLDDARLEVERLHQLYLQLSTKLEA